MKTRKAVAASVAFLIFACCVVNYVMLYVTLFPLDDKWLNFNVRLSKVEQEINYHQDLIEALRESMFINNEVESPPGEKPVHLQFSLTNQTSMAPTCNSNTTEVPQVDIQMLELYRKLEFDNPDGGVWKQGWNITYNKNQWNSNRKLKIFVVPHSHNDPGWWKTFETYYTFQTKKILNNVVTELSKDKRKKFIWAEISFFQRWWDEQTAETQEVVKSLVNGGQLEIVAGGWVMPDEAVSHWIAQLTQLTEGHQWLKSNLDYIPKNSWSIDPFGLSPTMPFLLKESGVENLVIQRVHYAVKKRLAKKKYLEFRWRQLWDTDGSTELFTQMMPFFSYDVSHTCGPDPKICCQFDFYFLTTTQFNCSWNINPTPITDANLAKKANILLDQYRKKAQLFETNALLIPLGADFRYSELIEWEAQINSYQKLFDYINKNRELNVEIQFATLADYFNAVRELKPVNEFPTLSGDFFTYADRDEHYWSGYYTSRPFHKRLDRVLLGSLRGSELLSTMAWIRGNDQLAEENIAARLSEARRLHSLFQHHDGVTGTAREHVVIDYAQKMITALNNSAHVLQQSVAHLLKSPRNSPINSDEVYFTLDETRSHHLSPGEKEVLTLEKDNPPRKIILYNSLPRERTKIQTILISTPYAKVTDRMGHAVECQVSPTWVGPTALSDQIYELSFSVTVPGLGLTTYVIHAVDKDSLPKEVHLAKVTLYNTALPFSGAPGFTSPQIYSQAKEFSISQRSDLSATFGKSGLLKALHIGDTTFPVYLKFMKYGTFINEDEFNKKDQSGAYLFLPEKPEADPLTTDDNNLVHLITGPIVSKVFIELPYVRHTCTLLKSSGSDGLGLQILNEVDIFETQNFELAMRINTDIASGDQFFMDLNGFDIIRRQRFSKLPIQGNYYPFAAAGYIEDERARLTIVSAQPLGAASMASGQFEIMQDRRLKQDDNRGLGEGVMDNLLTNHLFTLVLEKKVPSCSQPSSKYPLGALSLAGHLTSEELLHPVIALHPRNSLAFELNAFFSPLSFDLPLNLNVVSLRIFPIPKGGEKGVGMVVHRQVLDLCWGTNTLREKYKVSEDGEIDLKKFLNYTEDWTISEAPLTFHSVGPSKKSSLINLCPYQVSSLLFHRIQS